MLLNVFEIQKKTQKWLKIMLKFIKKTDLFQFLEWSGNKQKNGEEKLLERWNQRDFTSSVV